VNVWRKVGEGSYWIMGEGQKTKGSRCGKKRIKTKKAMLGALWKNSRMSRQGRKRESCGRASAPEGVTSSKRGRQTGGGELL